MSNEITQEFLQNFIYDESTGQLSRKLFSRDETRAYTNPESRVMYRGKCYNIRRIAYALAIGDTLPDKIYLVDNDKPVTKDNILRDNRQVPFKRRFKSKASGLPKGVSFVKSKNKYQAHIYLDKLRSIGLFNTAQEASDAHDYCLQENKLFKFSGKNKTTDILELELLLKRNIE